MKLLELILSLLCLCFMSAQCEEVYGNPITETIATTTTGRDFDLDLRDQHDLTSATVIPQDQLLKIIAGAEKGNKGQLYLHHWREFSQLF